MNEEKIQNSKIGWERPIYKKTFPIMLIGKNGNRTPSPTPVSNLVKIADVARFLAEL